MEKKKNIQSKTNWFYLFPGQENSWFNKNQKSSTTTLQGINISHLGKGKIIFKMPFWGDMLVPWRVILMVVAMTWHIDTLLVKVFKRPNGSGGRCSRFLWRDDNMLILGMSERMFIYIHTYIYMLEKHKKNNTVWSGKHENVCIMAHVWRPSIVDSDMSCSKHQLNWFWCDEVTVIISNQPASSQGRSTYNKTDFSIGKCGNADFPCVLAIFQRPPNSGHRVKNSPTTNIHPAELKSVNVWNIYHMLSLFLWQM